MRHHLRRQLRHHLGCRWQGHDHRHDGQQQRLRGQRGVTGDGGEKGMIATRHRRRLHRRRQQRPPAPSRGGRHLKSGGAPAGTTETVIGDNTAVGDRLRRRRRPDHLRQRRRPARRRQLGAGSGLEARGGGDDTISAGGGGDTCSGTTRATRTSPVAGVTSSRAARKRRHERRLRPRLVLGRARNRHRLQLLDDHRGAVGGRRAA